MNLKWFQCLVIILATFCFAVSSFGEAKKTQMPDGFADIYLGMALADFLAVRSNVERFFDFSSDRKNIDPNIPDQMLYQKTPNDVVFDQALYNFRGSRLDTIVLFGELKGIATTTTEGFINTALSKWGVPSEMRVVELDEGKGKSTKAPALIWKQDGILIAIAYTPEKDQERTNRRSIQLKIQRVDHQEAEPLKKLFVLPALSEKETSDILTPLQLIVRHWQEKEQKPSKPAIGE